MQFRKILSVLVSSAIICSVVRTVFADEQENVIVSDSPANVETNDTNDNDVYNLNADKLEPGDMTLLELSDAALEEFEIPEFISMKEIRTNKNVNRLYAQEPDEYTAVFQNKDGTKTMYSFNEPIKYRDKNGVMTDKQTTLSESVCEVNDLLSDDYAYVSPENNINTFFPKTLSDEVGMLVTDGKYNIELSPKENEQQSYESSEIIQFTAENGHKKDCVEYEDVFGASSKIRYSASVNGMKEDIILSGYDGINSFSFTVTTNGLKLKKADGYFLLCDPQTNEEIGNLSEVILFDSSNGENTIVPQGYVVGYEAVETVKNNEYVVTITIDEDFLENEAVYPVTIDPSITIASNGSGSAKTIIDTPIYSNKSTTNFGTYSTGTVGYQDSTYGVGRLLVRFPGLDSNTTFQRLKGNEITSAQLVLYEGTGNSSTSTLSVRYSTYDASWSESYPTYANHPSSLGSAMSTTKISKSGACYFNFTDLAVASKYNGYDIKKGIEITNANTTSASYRRSFYMSEYSSSKPRVIIQWSPFTDGMAYVLKTYSNGTDYCLQYNGGKIIDFMIEKYDNSYYSAPGEIWCAKASKASGYLFYSSVKPPRAADGDYALCTDNNGNVTVSLCTSDTNPYFCWNVEKISSTRYALKNVYSGKWLSCDSDSNYCLTSNESSRQIFSFSADNKDIFWKGSYANQSGTYKVNVVFENSSDYNNFKDVVKEWNGITDKITINSYAPGSNPTGGISVRFIRKELTNSLFLNGNNIYATTIPNYNSSKDYVSPTGYANNYKQILDTNWNDVTVIINGTKFNTKNLDSQRLIIMHEMGHVLKLRHTDDYINDDFDYSAYSIMPQNSMYMSSHITAYDKANLIKKWRSMP